MCSPPQPSAYKYFVPNYATFTSVFMCVSWVSLVCSFVQFLVVAILNSKVRVNAYLTLSMRRITPIRFRSMPYLFVKFKVVFILKSTEASECLERKDLNAHCNITWCQLTDKQNTMLTLRLSLLNIKLFIYILYILLKIQVLIFS